ncbi:MAG: hypothetical protein Q8T08_24540, partial [Ignavibacteria bacterium]|nr:hypothetical protein [Ignavibacteria bacterium]
GGCEALVDELMKAFAWFCAYLSISFLEHGPAGVIRQSSLPGHKLSDVIDGLGEELNILERLTVNEADLNFCSTAASIF